MRPYLRIRMIPHDCHEAAIIHTLQFTARMGELKVM